MQRRFGLQMEAEVMKKQTGNHFLSAVLNGLVTVIPGIRLEVPVVLGDDDLDPVLQHARGDERIPKRRAPLTHQLHRVHNRFFATVEYTPFRGIKNFSNDVLSLTDWHWSCDFLSGNSEKLAQILHCRDATALSQSGARFRLLLLASFRPAGHKREPAHSYQVAFHRLS